MKIMYPLANQFDYEELRYSLRSIEKFIDYDEIIIVGDYMPEWLINVTWIDVSDIPNKKQLSIKKKILAALEYTKEFLFMNDDMYFLQPVSEFPYYYKGYLKHYAEAGSKQLEKELEAKKWPTKNFDTHYPLIYNKYFKLAAMEFTEDTIIKSMFCNFLEIEGVFLPDCKMVRETSNQDIREFIKDRFMFSTGIYSIDKALPVLAELYPKKSIFEL